MVAAFTEIFAIFLVHFCIENFICIENNIRVLSFRAIMKKKLNNNYVNICGFEINFFHRFLHKVDNTLSL